MEKSYFNSLFGNINTSVGNHKMDSSASYLSNASNAFNSASNILQSREQLDVLNKIRESQKKQIDLGNEVKQFEFDLAKEQKEINDKIYENYRIGREELSTISKAGVDRTTYDINNLITNGGTLNRNQEQFEKDIGDILSKGSKGKVNSIEEFIKNPEKSLYQGIDRSVFETIEKYWKLKQDLNLYNSGSVTNEELHQWGNAVYQRYAQKGQDYNTFMKPFIEANDLIKQGNISDKANRLSNTELDLINTKKVFSEEENKVNKDLDTFLNIFKGNGNNTIPNNANTTDNANQNNTQDKPVDINNNNVSNAINNISDKDIEKYKIEAERTLKTEDFRFANNDNNKVKVDEAINKSFNVFNVEALRANSQRLFGLINEDTKDIPLTGVIINDKMKDMSFLGGTLDTNNKHYNKYDSDFIKMIQSNIDEKTLISKINLSEFDRDKMSPKVAYYYDIVAQAQETSDKYLGNKFVEGMNNIKDYREEINQIKLESQKLSKKNDYESKVKLQEYKEYINKTVKAYERFKTLKDFNDEQKKFIEANNSNADIILDDKNTVMRSNLLMVVQGFNKEQTNLLLSALSDDSVSNIRLKLNKNGIKFDELEPEERRKIINEMSSSIRNRYVKLNKSDYNDGSHRDPNFYNIALQLFALDSYIGSIANDDEEGISRKFNYYKFIKGTFNES